MSRLPVRRAVTLSGLVGLLGMLGLVATPRGGEAQGYRGEVRLGGSFLELRLLERDSLPESAVPGDGLRRRLADGTVVTCVPDEFCRWFGSGAVEGIQVLTQDVRAVAWGEIRGLSAHAHVRGRYGTDAFWPRSGQRLEAVTAYLNYDAGDVRVRGGRQLRTGGLGYHNFDGVAVLWRGLSPLRLEGFAGWSLGRGLNAPRSGELLSEADEFAPDDRGLLLGGELSGRWGRRLSAALLYQREIRTDLDALYTERVALDARALLGGIALDGSAAYDVALDEVNEARLRASVPLPARLHATAEVRHDTPFFELWTIWGAFSPVGFNEARGSLAWSPPRGDLTLEAGGAYRRYEETGAGTRFARARRDGWRVFGDARGAADGWFAGAGYRAEVGFGAARLGGDVRLGRDLPGGARVAVRGSSTQTFGEFRLGEQRLTGGGVEAAWRWRELELDGSVGLYRLSFENRAERPDWTQLRGHMGVSWRFGTEPGSAGAGR